MISEDYDLLKRLSHETQWFFNGKGYYLKKKTHPKLMNNSTDVQKNITQHLTTAHLHLSHCVIGGEHKNCENITKF